MKYLSLLLISLICSVVNSIPLDDYVGSPEEVYKWRILANETRKTLFGNTLYVLNVTSLKWLDTSKAYGYNGDLWTHLVYICVPPVVKNPNVSFALITNGDNDVPNKVSGLDTDQQWEVDIVAHYSQNIAVGIFQIPNQPYFFPEDPDHQRRIEDAIIAWGWKHFLADPEKDPRWLLRLPMVKAAYQCMRAATEFLEQQDISKPEGWVVTGSSKRGWTTWDVGVTRCETCVKILAIAPQVPIVPDINSEVHHMWQTLGGFTWTFQDYLHLNLTQQLSTPEWNQARNIIDPIVNVERLAEIPIYEVVSSDDEFMQFEWTSLYYDKLPGEKHVYIIPNAEHEFYTAYRRLYSVLATWYQSIASGVQSRPTFDYQHDNSTGEISIQMLETNRVKPTKVRLQHAQTLTSQRRDFRWLFQSNNNTEPCTLPYIPIPGDQLERAKKNPFFQKHPELGATNICFAPIIWHSIDLEETAPGYYKATPPEPKEGYWMGYYIEVEFPGDDASAGDMLFRNHFTFTTPGFVWPDTMPFDDCEGEGCWSKWV